MELEELFTYKNKIMAELCSNEAIVKLITDREDSEVPNHTLAYSQIFPYEYLPETIDEGHTFVCFDVDVQSVENKTFLNPVLYIWEFTHKSKLRIDREDGGGVRIDRLATEINKVFNGNRNFGLGELNLVSVERFSPILDYLGRVITYSAKDFNRRRPSKPAPNVRH